MRNSQTMLLLALIAIGLGVFWWALHRTPAGSHAGAAAPTAGAGKSAGNKPLYWYDPMVPDQHFDQPGKSPFMDMQLVPKYAGDGAAASTIAIDPATVQNLGLRTAPVERAALELPLRSVGTVMADEHRVYAVQARASGWIQHLAVRAVGDPVKRGETFAVLTSPDLIASQQELALAQRSGDAALTQAARERLALLGGGPRAAVVVAPADGVVTELNAREGAQVTPGTPLAQIADLSQVWVDVALPEAQGGRVALGQQATLHLPALPGSEFKAKIAYVYPDLDAATRTLHARLQVANGDGALRPGMYAEVTLAQAAAPAMLVVPSEALIRTGTRTMVIVADDQQHFHPVAVKPGEEGDGRTQILAGLEEGQRVVISGQFLIDSEANLRGAFERLDANPTESPRKDDSKAAPKGGAR